MNEFDPKREFQVGRWHVSPLRGSLRDGDDSHHLEPKVMDVLVFLVSQAGEVVERDAIATKVWGGRYVSDDPLSRCIADLRRILGDSARESSYIETIHKRGYRLVAPVSFARAVKKPRATGQLSARSPLLAVAVVVSIVAAAGVLILLRSGQAPSVDAAPRSIAVLPFEDLSDSGENEAFADGLSEILIHQLAQQNDLQVIAKNSSFAFKGQNVDVRVVGRTLITANLLEGSVQRLDGKFRITAQLIDAKSGVHIWSKIYEPSASNQFAVQDEIARQVTAEVGHSLLGSDRSASSLIATRELEAYELYLLGRQKAAGPKAIEAVALFQQAIARDPTFSLAYAGLADALWQTVRNKDASNTTAATIEQARKMAARAVELGPNLAEGYASQLLLASYDQDLESVEKWYEMAVSRNAGHAPAYIRYGDSLQRSGWLLLDESLLDQASVVFKHAATLDPLNARLKQRIAELSHLRGDAEAISQAQEGYRTARSRSEAAIALNTLARISADRGSLDQAIAYLQIGSDVGEHETGMLSLELASNYLQLKDYSKAQTLLDRVPRPLDWMGMLQLAMLLQETEQLDELEVMLEAVIQGSDENYGLSSSEGEAFALVMSGSPLNCQRVFELSERVNVGGMRGAHIPTADILLSVCHKRASNMNSAMEHQQFAVEVAEKLEEFEGRDAFTLYAIAAVKSLAGDRDSALDYLEFSYDRGACFMGVIERDPTLVGLHEDFRYQSLLSEFRANIERMRRNVYRAEASNDWYSLVAIESRSW